MRRLTVLRLHTPALGGGKTVLCLELSTHIWPLLLEVDPSICGARTMATAPWREAAQLASTGGSEEPLTLLRVEEQQPGQGREQTKFTLSWSFRTAVGQAERVDVPAAWVEEHGACLERGSACPRKSTQHKGTLPTTGSTAQPERYRGPHYK